MKPTSLNSMPEIYYFMASPSKEDNVLRLILENSPLKEWHFEEIVKQAKVTKAVANKWLKKYIKEGLLKRKREKGKFPHFTAGSNNPAYQSKKRIYALQRLYDSGLMQELASLSRAKTIVIFGSTIKGDWYRDSDIDIFVYGSAEGFNKSKYQAILKREIELHVFENMREIKEIKTGLIKNVTNGYLVKGQMQDLAEAS
jgi:predicted nucleotidyltransferase